MNKDFVFQGHLSVEQLFEFVFQRENFKKVSVNPALLDKTAKSHQTLMALIAKGIPIYGVTTGFGDSSVHYVNQDLSVQLQKNLIEYLSCGLGNNISIEASRAMTVIRLNSLCQGISGVSPELLKHMCMLLEHDILPVVPQEGSLGASGDLIPLAYLGQVIQGQGEAYYQGKITDVKSVYQKLNLTPYTLKPKEGLAIVNGTSTMAGVMTVNLKLMKDLMRLSEMSTAWLCLVLKGKREAFSPFINEVAKTNPGQALAAKNVRRYLDEESYFPPRGENIRVDQLRTEDFIQDRYSLRCVPQVLGPIHDHLKTAQEYLEHEINSVTDNPVINQEGQLEMGGNFYGGYLCQAMDMMKINLAHIADLTDRQLMMLFDNKVNRGISTNLVFEENLSSEERNIHHGLKGLHQAVSAITSEVMQKAIPNGIFSRSSESHNQDKVSLGMSAANVCSDMVNGVYKIITMHMTCLAQALDLQKIELQSPSSKRQYQLIREIVPFTKQDRSLGLNIKTLKQNLERHALYEKTDSIL